MSVEYDTNAGYGFVLEPLNKQADIYDVLYKVYDDEELHGLSLDVSGDTTSGENMITIAFLPQSIFNFSKYNPITGCTIFEPYTQELSNEVLHDIEILKKYYSFKNDNVMPIVSFRIS